MSSLEPNIFQMQDYFKFDLTYDKFNNDRQEQPESFVEDDLKVSRDQFYGSQQASKSNKHLNNELLVDDSFDNSEENLSMLLGTYPSGSVEQDYEETAVQKHNQAETHKLVLSKPKIQLSLLYTQTAEETIKIMNKNQFKLTIKARLRDQLKGVTIIAPPFIERLSHQTISISIDEIQELGDIFNAIVVEASSQTSFESFEIPLIIRYERPRLRLEYQGSTCFLNINSNRHPHIMLKASTFEEYMLHITSSHKVDMVLETPMTKSSVFPDELIVSNEKRKIAIRAKNKEFCLVAKIKQTQLAFVCKISVIE